MVVVVVVVVERACIRIGGTLCGLLVFFCTHGKMAFGCSFFLFFFCVVFVTSGRYYCVDTVHDW